VRDLKKQPGGCTQSRLLAAGFVSLTNASRDHDKQLDAKQGDLEGAVPGRCEAAVPQQCQRNDPERKQGGNGDHVEKVSEVCGTAAAAAAEGAAAAAAAEVVAAKAEIKGVATSKTTLMINMLTAAKYA
jgi:hypothetical protein